MKHLRTIGFIVSRWYPIIGGVIAKTARRSLRLIGFGVLAALPALAQPVIFPTATYTVVLMPPPPSAPASRMTLTGLGEFVGNAVGQNTIYVTGLTYPGASPQASEWTLNLSPGLPLAAGFASPTATPASLMRSLPAAATANLRAFQTQAPFSYGVAVNTTANNASLAVGETIFGNVVQPDGYQGTYSVRHATSWHLVNGVYTPADMDSTGLFANSSVSGVVAQPHSLLAFGYGQTIAYANPATAQWGYAAKAPVIWTLAQNANSFNIAVLPPLLAGGDARVLAASKRIDKNTVVGMALGSASGVANGRPVMCPAYWRGTGTPINLADPARLQLFNTGLPANSIGGAAYGVASFSDEDSVSTDDIVAGVVTGVVPNGNKTRRMNKALVWLSKTGGGAPFTSSAVDFTAAAGNNGVIIDNSTAEAVNASEAVVGRVQFHLANNMFFMGGGGLVGPGWNGYIATQNAGGTWSAEMIVPDVNSLPGIRITAVKAINDAGVMIGTIQVGQGFVQDAILVPNPGNVAAAGTLPAPAAN